MIAVLVRKYWREMLIVVMVIGISLAWSQDHKSLIKAYETTVNSYEKQMDDLNESYERELQRKEEALQDYQKKMEEIEKDYSKFKEKVETQKAERVVELTDIRHSDPDKLVKEIENAFGFEYVK